MKNTCPKINSNYGNHECSDIPNMYNYINDAVVGQINDCLYSALIQNFGRAISEGDYKNISLSINNQNMNTDVFVFDKLIGQIKQYWNNFTLITEFTPSL